MYSLFFKRFFDFVFSFLCIVILSPIIIILIILGFIYMKGNPFFTQKRPGKNEKIFNLIKFRTMSNEKDKEGKLLPDDIRLNKYGRFLRSTSLDELPELINIFIGDMSFIGPRPLLVKYLPYYTDEERKRHNVRPGLTGLSQANGRNNLNWEDRFKTDVEYINTLSLKNDIKILIDTVKTVINHSDVELNVLEDFDEYRKNQQKSNL